jgi:hypothetical protein
MTQQHPAPSIPSSFRVHLFQMTKNVLTLNEGDYVLVKGTLEEYAYLAKILKIVSPDRVLVRYVDSYTTKTLSLDAIQPHRPIQQGDWVLIPPSIEDVEEGHVDWVSNEVGLMYPTGFADIIWSDDETEGDDIDVETLNVATVYLDEDKAGLPAFRLDWRDQK